jgi:hypothetical protein
MQRRATHAYACDAGRQPHRPASSPNGPGDRVRWCDGRPHLTSWFFFFGADDCSLAWKGGNPLRAATLCLPLPTWPSSVLLTLPKRKESKLTPRSLSSLVPVRCRSWTLESATATEPGAARRGAARRGGGHPGPRHPSRPSNEQAIGQARRLSISSFPCRAGFSLSSQPRLLRYVPALNVRVFLVVVDTASKQATSSCQVRKGAGRLACTRILLASASLFI